MELTQRKLLLPILGIAGIMLVVGFVTGQIGAKLQGKEEGILSVPHVVLIPDTIFHVGPVAVTNTLLSAWLTTAVLVLVFTLGTRKLSLIPGRLQGLLETFIEVLRDFIDSVAGERLGRVLFPILATMFLFVAFNAWIALLPIYPSMTVAIDEAHTTHVLRSAGTDINMPLALAIIAFVLAEFWGFKAHGLGYLREFVRVGVLARGIMRFNPGAIFFGLIDAAVGVLEVVSHLIRLVSFTFRLFGSMLAGEIVLLMVTFLLTFMASVAFYGLEVLVGGVQALIFVGLTLVFTTMAVASHESDEESGSH